MTTVPRQSSRFLVLSASLREDSLNAKMAALAAASIESQGGVAELVSIRAYDSPSFDADVEETQGLPTGAQAFRDRLESNDAFVVASPEYNSSMPGVLRNSTTGDRPTRRRRFT